MEAVNKVSVVFLLYVDRHSVWCRLIAGTLHVQYRVYEIPPHIHARVGIARFSCLLLASTVDGLLNDPIEVVSKIQRYPLLTGRSMAISTSQFRCVRSSPARFVKVWVKLRLYDTFGAVLVFDYKIDRVLRPYILNQPYYAFGFLSFRRILLEVAPINAAPRFRVVSSKSLCSPLRRPRRFPLRLCPPGGGVSFCLGAHGLLHRRVAGEPVQPRVSVRRRSIV